MNFTISGDILSLFILSALTIIGYMIAINAKGVIRISLSYLMATVLLAVNVIVVVQTLNEMKSDLREEEFQQKILEERQLIADRLKSEQDRLLEKNKDVESRKEKRRLAVEAEVASITEILNEANQIATTVETVQLQDYTLEYSQWVDKARRSSTKITLLKKKYDKLKEGLEYTKSATSDIDNGFVALQKAAKYYKLFYVAEDSEQENVREAVLRKSAREAKSSFATARKIVNTVK